jgi:hypothetical protein
MPFLVQKIIVAGDDPDGALLMAGGKLIAILCQLSALHGKRMGRWHVEWIAGSTGAFFDDFPDLETACAMLGHRLKRDLGIASAA